MTTVSKKAMNSTYTGGITQEDFLDYFRKHYDDYLYHCALSYPSAAILELVLEYINTRPLDELGDLMDDDQAINDFYDVLFKKYYDKLTKICEDELQYYM